MSKTRAIATKTKFGIEELLKADAHVLYENIFSTRHVGRVVDFLLHEARAFVDSCKDPGFAEYRIRHALELAIFNAWSNYRKGETAKCIEIELGWDSSQLAVGVSYVTEADIAGFMPGDEKPANPISARMGRMFGQIQALSDGLVIRHSPSASRIQVIALISSTSDGISGAPAPDYIDLTNVESSTGDKPASEVVPLSLSEGKLDAFLADENAEGGPRTSASTSTSVRKKPKSVAEIRAGADIGIGTDTATDTDTATTTVTAPAAAPAAVTVTATTATVTDTTTTTVTGSDSDFDIDALTAKILGSGTTTGPSNTLVRGGPAEEETKTTVSGGAQSAVDDIIKVKSSGGGDLISGEKTVVKGGAGQDANNDVQKVKHLGVAGSGAGSDDLERLTVFAEAHQTGAQRFDESANDAAMVISDKLAENADSIETEESMQILLNTIKAEVVPLCPGLSQAQFQEAFRGLSQKIRENYTQTLHHLMRVKNIQTIAKVKHYKDQLSAMSARVDELKTENKELLETVAKKDATEAQILELKNGEHTAHTGSNQTGLEAHLKEQLKNYEAAIARGEVPPQAQAWAKGFLEAMMKERALLGQKLKAVDTHLRKREHEFRGTETKIKESLRVKEEQLRQKDFSLQKTKESLANTLTVLEKSRSAVKLENADKSELVAKVTASEKLLDVATGNNERLSKRVEELQKKWHEESNSRGALQKDLSEAKRKLEDTARKVAVLSNPETAGGKLAETQQQRDKAMKVIDELKRQIKELQTKLNAILSAHKASASIQNATKGGTPMSDVEHKHKLDQANKLVKAMKDEVERTRKRFDEVKLEETKLRVEVAKLQGQLRAAGRTATAATAAAAAATAAAAAAAAAQPAGSQKPTQKTSSGISKPIKPKS